MIRVICLIVGSVLGGEAQMSELFLELMLGYMLTF